MCGPPRLPAPPLKAHPTRRRVPPRCARRWRSSNRLRSTTPTARPRALGADAPVWGIDPAALRRQIVIDVGDPLLPPRPDPRDSPPATERDEAALNLTRVQRGEVQGRLTAAGHNTSGADGSFGPRTRAAITAWQTARGFPVTGFLNADQVAALREETPGWRPPRSTSGNTRTPRQSAPTPGSNSADLR